MTGDGVPRIDDWNRLLDGRVAVITGGGDGIGAGISGLSAQHGALVEVGEIDQERADRICDEVIPGLYRAGNTMAAVSGVER